MAKKIKPSDRILKRRIFESIIQQTKEVNEIIKDGIRPATQLQEDLKDQLQLVSVPTKAKNIDYLPLSINDVGFFVVDGQDLDVLHTKDSAHGRLLNILYEHRREPIERKRLKKLMNGLKIEQPLKDLRAQLRKIGLEPDIKSSKQQGTVTFHGIHYK